MSKAERTHDYPAKNAAREAWMRFLPESFLPNASGLYLSGTENLEREGYVRKGISPARLVSPEHLGKLQPSVEANAQGIQIVRGSIQDAVRFIEAEKLSPLSVVHLDFDGLYNTFIQQILSVFRVFPNETEGWIALTSFRARADHAHLTRELGLLWWIAFILGLVGPLKHGVRIVDTAHLEHIDAVLQRITRRASECVEAEKEVRVFREAELAKRLSAHKSVL